MSIVVRNGIELEDICEVIVAALAHDAELLESVEIKSETRYEQLPIAVIKRLEMQPGQKNLLVRMALRSLHSSITNQYANQLREKVFQALDSTLRT